MIDEVQRRVGIIDSNPGENPILTESNMRYRYFPKRRSIKLQNPGITRLKDSLGPLGLSDFEVVGITENLIV